MRQFSIKCVNNENVSTSSIVMYTFSLELPLVPFHRSYRTISVEQDFVNYRNSSLFRTLSVNRFARCIVLPRCWVTMHLSEKHWESIEWRVKLNFHVQLLGPIRKSNPRRGRSLFNSAGNCFVLTVHTGTRLTDELQRIVLFDAMVQMLKTDSQEVAQRKRRESSVRCKWCRAIYRGQFLRCSQPVIWVAGRSIRSRQSRNADRRRRKAGRQSGQKVRAHCEFRQTIVIQGL